MERIVKEVEKKLQIEKTGNYGGTDTAQVNSHSKVKNNKARASAQARRQGGENEDSLICTSQPGRPLG